MSEIKKFGKKKQLLAKVFLDNEFSTLVTGFSQMPSGLLVEANSGYIHILDQKDSDLSYMFPWHKIKEVQLIEVDEGDDE